MSKNLYSFEKKIYVWYLCRFYFPIYSWCSQRASRESQLLIQEIFNLNLNIFQTDKPSRQLEKIFPGYKPGTKYRKTYYISVSFSLGEFCAIGGVWTRKMRQLGILSSHVREASPIPLWYGGGKPTPHPPTALTGGILHPFPNLALQRGISPPPALLFKGEKQSF